MRNSYQRGINATVSLFIVGNFPRNPFPETRLSFSIFQLKPWDCMWRGNHQISKNAANFSVFEVNH